VEFSINISNLETKLKEFIDSCFESILSIEHSLSLHRKFCAIMSRDTLKKDLNEKKTRIFQN